jgi:hypothetical protein
MIKNLSMILLTIIIGFLGSVNSASADQPDQSIVDIQLLVTPREIPLGAATTIELIIKPTEPITEFHASFSDNNVWEWVHEFEPPQVITKTIVLTSTITPLNLGTLTPSILVDYIVAGKSFREYVEANSRLDVKAVSEFVSFDITTNQGTVGQNNEVEFHLNVANRSPFSLTVNQIEGVGIDLNWHAYSGKDQIGPGDYVILMRADVRGEHPQPQLTIGYSWNDALGKPGSAVNNIIGREISYRSSLNLIDRIPFEVLGIIIGIIAGSLSLLANDWVMRQLQKGTNCRQVFGMLQVVIMEVNHGATNSSEIRVDLLETMIKTEGFYQVLSHFDLVDNVRELWGEASKHNKSLNSPGNIHREKELRKAADTLSKNIPRISMGWIKYSRVKFANRRGNNTKQETR